MIVWIDKLHDCEEKFDSLTTESKKIGKRYFFRYNNNGCQQEMCFFKNIDFIDKNYHCKNWVDWLSARREKISKFNNLPFEKKGMKVKKHNILTFNDHLPLFSP